ncbi:DUF2490 domain-containing protein [Mesonia aquimarina]|uniref:DUF2490 domain-containing protein n=1 Tax=Mesonia aquimarina TaxID=1504967 RepID=UPI000EF6062A
MAHQKPLSFLNIKKPLVKSFHAGAGVIYTQNYNAKDNFEFRLSQGFKFDIPTINQITLNNYFRIEERFQNSFTNSGFTSGFRLRHRVSTDLKLKNNFIHFTDHLYIPLGAEIFVNLKKSDRFNDLVRFYPGLGYQTKNQWKFELYLIYNRTKNITETSNSSNDFILRLRVYDGGNKTFLDKSNKEKNSKEPLKDD